MSDFWEWEPKPSADDFTSRIRRAIIRRFGADRLRKCSLGELEQLEDRVVNALFHNVVAKLGELDRR